MAKGKLLKVASVWKKSSGPAGDYFSGVFGKIPDGVELKEGVRFFIFANKEPAKESSPTHFIQVPEPEKKDESGPGNDW